MRTSGTSSSASSSSRFATESEKFVGLRGPDTGARCVFRGGTSVQKDGGVTLSPAVCRIRICVPRCAQAGGVEILECCQGMQKFSEALSAMFFLSFSKNWVPIGAFETLPFVRAPWKQGAMDKVELVELR